MARMKGMVQVRGIKTIMRNMRSTHRDAGRDCARGLKKGGLYLQRKSQEIVPVQFGPLKASAFTRNIGGKGFDTDMIVGYTMDYAAEVHENLDNAHGAAFNKKHAEKIKNATTSAEKRVWFNRGVNQQAKFLEAPARLERTRIIKIVAAEFRF